MNDWRIYERFVARLMSEQTERNCTAIPNTKLMGRFSGTLRQIDVLIDSRHEHIVERRIIVDAKRRKRPIDVKQVEEFEGMMRDVGAHRGILVCPNGYTPAARRRAQDAISIRLVPLSDLESLDLTTWDQCSHNSCNGLVIWDANPALEIGPLLAVQAISKCDECNRFNVWCFECQHTYALDTEDEWQCPCAGPWFWLTSIEDESDDPNEKLPAAYLLLCYGMGNYAVVDRRPLK